MNSPKRVRKPTEWDKFRSKHAGKQMSTKELSAEYQKIKKSALRKSVAKKSPVKRVIKSVAKKSTRVKNQCTINRTKKKCGSNPQCSWVGKNKKTPCRMGRGSHQGTVYQGPHLNI